MTLPSSTSTRPEPSRPASAFAAVDLGASSGRVMLGTLTATGLELNEVHRFPNRPVTTEGELCWDVDALFAETLEGLGRAVARCEATGATLSGIGVDSWGVDYAIIDEAGAITRPVLHHRGAPDPAPWIAGRPLDEAAVFALSGVPDQAINTSLRLSAQNARAAFAGERLLFIPDLWVYLLTGVLGTEPTIASTSQLLDASSGDWSEELVALHGLDGLTLPPVRAPGSFAGLTTEAITSRIGSATAVPVYRVAGHDTAGAFAFAEPVAPGDTGTGLVSSGTWSLVGTAAAVPALGRDALEAGFTNERGIRGTLLLQNLNGMWILHQCMQDWETDAAAPAAPPLDVAGLVAEAALVPASAAVFDVADERLLAPGGMVERVATLAEEAGRARPETRAETVRAVLDSLAAAYARGVQRAGELTGARLTAIRIVGGGSKNALLCQLTADISGLPVTAGPAEASSIGTIAAQIVASGLRRDLAEVYTQVSGDGAGTTDYLPGGDPFPSSPASNPSAPTAPAEASAAGPLPPEGTP
ncbi:MAG: rhamnulokinase [Herbiconiux sp.]|uniref:rhamnulokinase n=1 Tax=Herbiconiux sp. TaxID=1871186 RepID=UPI00122AAAB5|nr:FGGY-family carbohydrate kinase [Herbiconiux sp.]TAJ50121.1 MAG: rhamnulokinase [Herbiconiux sp.]